jgi:uncharacterized protein (DUF924 family)
MFSRLAFSSSLVRIFRASSSGAHNGSPFRFLSILLGTTTALTLSSSQFSPEPFVPSLVPRAFCSSPLRSKPWPHDTHRAQDVLTYWLGAFDGSKTLEKKGIWFAFSEERDAEIRDLFGGLVRSAMGGGLTNWESHPRAALAKVILLDQFTRNIHRKKKKAFEGDSEARRLAKMALNRWPEYYNPIEKFFLLLPFMHSETIGDQDLCVRYYTDILREARMDENVSDEVIEFLESVQGFVDDHRNTIINFRRFPSRNAAMGRESTQEEVEYLKTHGGWGQ